MHTKTYAAIDLGASSGRVMLGTYDGEHLSLEEVHRFSNDPVTVGGTFYWDVLRLLHEIKTGLREAGLVLKDRGKTLSGIGIDTWGVDYGIIDRRGKLVGNPVHYRDSRTDGMPEAIYQKFSAEALYQETGIQLIQLNTVFQLAAEVKDNPAAFSERQTLLYMPDLLGYFLTGQKVSEFSIAATSQLLNADTGVYSGKVLDTIGVPGTAFPPIVQPGTVLGVLLPAVQEECGLGDVPVFSVCGHDTASAVCAVPSADESFAFISSGTWSLFGTEIDTPLRSAQAVKHNFTNERGPEGKVRFLRNHTGLWLIQESRRQWEREGRKYSYAQLEQSARAEADFTSVINTDDAAFTPPGDIPGRIRALCENSGVPAPQNVGQTVQCIYISLAAKYKQALADLKECTGKDFSAIHVIGGGTKDNYLCQLTADATGLPVLAGPTEATVIGNIGVQLAADGLLNGLADIRRCVYSSFPPIVYEPSQG
ncbi:MAG: rhamnulokinase [Oscillospiraceae bacterium]|jgi:sugar (pentulose or hexulose) kinase|nr:rhamnulokinase [Oscillospiraceae bacterium]